MEPSSLVVAVGHHHRIQLEEPCGHRQATGCLSKERRAGEGDREALIIEVRSEYGRPPYLVRWHDGRQNVHFPASADTLIVDPSASAEAA
jgi:hypothetical protein